VLVFTAVGVDGPLRLFRYRAGAHQRPIATRAAPSGAVCVRRPALERSQQRA
jgi:hypothetical protein